MKPEFHLTWFPPCHPYWPRGGWSVYQITGDQIADRIQRDEKGKVILRDSWCGYLGIFEKIHDALAVIESEKASAA